MRPVSLTHCMWCTKCLIIKSLIIWGYPNWCSKRGQLETIGPSDQLTSHSPTQLSQTNHRKYISYHSIVTRPIHTALNQASDSGSSEHLKIGLINIIPVSSKAIMLNDLISECSPDMMDLELKSTHMIRETYLTLVLIPTLTSNLHLHLRSLIYILLSL